MHATTILLGAVAGYLCASLVQTVLHRLIGHGRWGGWVQTLHVNQHHRIYAGDELTAAHYAAEKSLSAYYLAPAALVLAAIFYFCPLAFALAFSAAALLSYSAHIVLHEHYHLSLSPLLRHAWFQRLRDLHLEHHRQQDRNFAVLDLFWDRLMGTYAAPPPEQRSQR